MTVQEQEHLERILDNLEASLRRLRDTVTQLEQAALEGLQETQGRLERMAAELGKPCSS